MKTLSDLEIAARIRAGKTFTVKSVRERKRVYDAAKFAGACISTGEVRNGFEVKFYTPTEA